MATVHSRSEELESSLGQHTFSTSVLARGFDLGGQLVQKRFRVHRDANQEPYMIEYKQSENSKLEQTVTSLGLSTSVKKQATFLFNDREGFDLALKEWPRRVKMVAFAEMVIRPRTDFEFARRKVRKDGCTFYLYYVKRTNAEVCGDGRQKWDDLLARIARMDDVNDTAVNPFFNKIVKLLEGIAGRLVLNEVLDYAFD